VAMPGSFAQSFHCFGQIGGSQADVPLYRCRNCSDPILADNLRLLFKARYDLVHLLSKLSFRIHRVDERYLTRIDGNRCKPGLNLMLGHPTISLGEPGYKTKVSFSDGGAHGASISTSSYSQISTTPISISYRDYRKCARQAGER